MKFRTLGVALLAGGGLALAALPASPAAAFDDKNGVGGPGGPGGPYPPVACSGPTGEGTVSESVLLVGEATIFSGCGFAPGSTVQIELNGEYEGVGTASETGTFSYPIHFPTSGTHSLAGIGYAPGTVPVGGGAVAPAPATPPSAAAPGTATTPPTATTPAPTSPVAPATPAPATPAPTAPAEILPAPAAILPSPTAPLPSDLAQGAPADDWFPEGLSAAAPPKFGLQTRIVTATVLVIGLGQGGIVGLPIDPVLVGSWISGFGFGDKDKDRDRDRDRDRACFGDGKFDEGDKAREDDGKLREDDKLREDERLRGDEFGGERRDGLAVPVDDRTPLLDDFDDKDDKDEFRDDKDRRGRDEFGDCIIAGGAVGVGVFGGGVGAGAGGGALPFTGVETGAMASIAFALLGGGVLLRVAARRRRLAGTRVQG